MFEILVEFLKPFEGLLKAFFKASQIKGLYLGNELLKAKVFLGPFKVFQHLGNKLSKALQALIRPLRSQLFQDPPELFWIFPWLLPGFIKALKIPANWVLCLASLSVVLLMPLWPCVQCSIG